MVTQQEIADKLGVSRQLVTFALGGYPQVSAHSRRRILEAARQMGYRPNPHAQALRRRRTGIIALWIPDQISSHYIHVARELGRLVKQARSELIVSEVSAIKTEELLAHVPVDGIFAVDAPKNLQLGLQNIATRAVPIVSMGAHCWGSTDQIEVDLKSGTTAVMEHLLGEGYRRIAHATFVRRTSPEEYRRTGYVRAMRTAGLKTEFILYPLSEQQRPLTRALIKEYVAEHGRPEAIFCHSDDAALGIYRGLCDLGIRVPDETALVGCDGIEDTEYLEHPLTTVVQPVAEMCATAWRFLQHRLENPDAEVQRTVLQPRLAIRESSSRRG